VNWGACMVARSATCFRSPLYPTSNYTNNAACSVTVAAHEQVTLAVTTFDTAPTDYLVADGGYYSGTTSPEGVQLAPGATISFTSDGSGTSSGFEVCGARAPTAAISAAAHPHTTGVVWD
jgi:hypothetical protein